MKPGKPKIKMTTDLTCVGRPSSRLADSCLLLVSTQWGEKSFPSCLFYKGTNPVHNGCTLVT